LISYIINKGRHKTVHPALNWQADNKHDDLENTFSLRVMYRCEIFLVLSHYRHQHVCIVNARFARTFTMQLILVLQQEPEVSAFVLFHQWGIKNPTDRRVALFSNYFVITT